MTANLANAIISTAYNLHIRKGEAMTPAKASKLSRGDRAALCRLLEQKGGSDLYTREQAAKAFAFVVA
jgi:hypothetical protein